jgi:hypothetical protein
MYRTPPLLHFLSVSDALLDVKASTMDNPTARKGYMYLRHLFHFGEVIDVQQ